MATQLISDSSLAYLDDRSLKDVVRRIAGLVDPFVVSHGRVVAKTGETIYGEFIALPQTAEQLAAMPKEDAAVYVRRALHLARDRGAEMVGLGAFTSVVTLGGRAATDAGVPITTGNSYAAVASAEAACKALILAGCRERPPSQYNHLWSHWGHRPSDGADVGRGRGPTYPGRQSRNHRASHVRARLMA